MKKLLLLMLIFIMITSVSATSYTQSAADVSPGAFPEGMYTFPDQLLVGATSTSRDASVYIENNGRTYPLYAFSTDISNPAIIGVGSGKGVTGMTTSSSTSNAAVYGISSSGAPGVYGYDSSGSGIGVKAYSSRYGFYTSGADYGIYIPDSDRYGVYAVSDTTAGYFVGDGSGVVAQGDTYGVYGLSASTGVYGYSSSSSALNCGVKGYNVMSTNIAYLGCYNYGIYTPDDAKIGGDLYTGTCSHGCDVAEKFAGEDLEPGDVVIIDSSTVRGVRKTTTAYDNLAAGIVSTKPTVTMGEEGTPVALSGVVPTKVIGKVNVGDLLTTSTTAGYAMACDDYSKCAGAIIGKAMESNNAGKGKITALVMLG